MTKERELFRNNKDYEKNIEGLKSKPKEQALYDMLEKAAVLGFLIGNDANKLLSMGYPVMNYIFDGHFADTPPRVISAKFKEISIRYKKMLQALTVAEIKRNSSLPGAGRKYIVPFLKANDIVGKNGASLIKKEFEIDVIRKKEKVKTLMGVLLTQAFKNIARREAEGISQLNTKMHLQEFLKGKKTPENCELVERLIAEANTQLQLLKLPTNYQGYEESMVDMLNEHIKQQTGEDPEVAVKKRIIAKQNIFENSIRSILQPKLPDLFDLKKAQKLKAEMKASKLEGTKKMGEKVERKQENMTQILSLPGEDGKPQPVPNYLKNLSLAELKKMGFKKIASIDASVNESGKMSIHNMSQEEIKKIEKDFFDAKNTQEEDNTIFDPNEDPDHITKPKKKKEHINKKLIEIGESYMKRCMKIEEALETGEPMDHDPMYLSSLRRSKKFQKIREENTHKPISPELWDIEEKLREEEKKNIIPFGVGATRPEVRDLKSQEIEEDEHKIHRRYDLFSSKRNTFRGIQSDFDGAMAKLKKDLPNL